MNRLIAWFKSGNFSQRQWKAKQLNGFFKSNGFVFFFFPLLFLGVGCSSARMSDKESDSLFRKGDYDQAATHLQKGLEKQGDDGRDLLLYLFDLGLSYHSAGKYDESNKVFLKADKIADIKDYTSLSKEAATLIASDNIKDYKGEDFEKVLINVYLSMNYAMMGNNEDSLVEARRVNQKLYMMVTEGQKKYKQNAFARYLSAILYEAEHNYNDAYVDYKNTWKLNPSFPGLGRDLWRCAAELRFDDEMEQWDKTFHLSEEDHKQARSIASRSNQSEIIVIYENGISPIKKPHPSFGSIPKFFPRPNPVSHADIEVNGQIKGSTSVLENIEKTAIENLDEKYAGIIAKKIAGAVAKKGVAVGISKTTHSPLLGFIAEVAMFASDQADLRSWSLLPKDLQMLRIQVDPGSYRVRALPVGAGALPEKVIQVEAGKKVFVAFRYMP